MASCSETVTTVSTARALEGMFSAGSYTTFTILSPVESEGSG